MAHIIAISSTGGEVDVECPRPDCGCDVNVMVEGYGILIADCHNEPHPWTDAERKEIDTTARKALDNYDGPGDEYYAA